MPPQATVSPCTKTHAGNVLLTWPCCSWWEMVRKTWKGKVERKIIRTVERKGYGENDKIESDRVTQRWGVDADTGGR